MRRRALGLGLAVVLLLGTLPAQAHDPSADLDRVRQELADLEAKIDGSKSESRKVGQQLAAAEERLVAALELVSAAQAKVDAKQGEIDVAEARFAELTADLALIETRLTNTRAELAKTEELLQRQAMEMYMDAATSSGAVMLAVSSGADLTVGLAYVDGLAGDSEDLMDSFEILKRDEERQQSDVEASRVALNAELVDLEEQRGILAAELAKVEDLRHEAEDELAEAQALLDRIRQEIAGYEQHKNSLEEDAARLQRELASRQSTGGSNPGVLSWPVAGNVSSPFGYRIHPIFGTRKLHTGIDISAGAGTPIKAAGSGTVLIAGGYGGYGNAVVIDHGGGLATLYAHQSSLAVSNGQKVDKGQVIGYVGCSGFCTGPHLHFETRESGVPVDPMKYLG